MAAKIFSNQYPGVIEFADFKSKIKIVKLKLADPRERKMRQMKFVRQIGPQYWLPLVSDPD